MEVPCRRKLVELNFTSVNKDQEIILTMAALAVTVPQTKQEDYNKIYNDGEQDGSKDIKV